MNTDTILLITGVCAGLIMLCSLAKRRRKLISAAFGSATGLCALFLLSHLGPAIGTDFPLNLFSLAGSAVLGVPFVAGLALLRFL